MVSQFSQVAIMFLPGDAASGLQPLDAGIIQYFRVEYRKRLIKYVLLTMLKDASATKIVKSVYVLVAIRWLQEAWKEVTNLTIKNCFEKCGIKGDNELMKMMIWNLKLL